MKVKELIARLSNMDPDAEVFTGYPVVAQNVKYQESACSVLDVAAANMPDGGHELLGRKFVLICTQGIDEVWTA